LLLIYFIVLVVVLVLILEGLSSHILRAFSFFEDEPEYEDEGDDTTYAIAAT
jgi:hypothetical protein